MNDIEQALAVRLPADASREAAARLAARAYEEGLLDIAYTVEDSPVGPLLLAATNRGLLELGYEGDKRLDSYLERLSAKISPRVLEAPARLDPVRRELDEYFEGRRRQFDVPVDYQLSAGFTRRVLTATARIPFGSVATYRDVATRAGNPSATRAAGNALGSNPIPIVVPCHRVVGASGSLVGYAGGLERKQLLLGLEGGLLAGLVLPGAHAGSAAQDLAYVAGPG
jgi:methylated-DNA-[protein]-cysteine S-methyltransferase